MTQRDHVAPWKKAQEYQAARDAVIRMFASKDPSDLAIAKRHNEALRELRIQVEERGVSASSTHKSTFMSNLSVQYANEEYIGERIMPVLSVDKLTNSFPSYAKRDRLATPDWSMAGRMTPNEIAQTDRTEDSYTCKAYGLKDFVEGKVIMNQDAPFNELMDLQDSVSELMALNREKKVATEVATAANYSGNNAAIAAADRWDTAGGGKPVKAILDAKAATWSGRGRARWVAVCSLDVFNVLRTNAQVLEALKYSGKGGIASREDLLRLFEVDELLVGKSREDTANEGKTASYSRIWGNTFSIHRVAESMSLRNAVWGYTMRFQGKVNTLMQYKAEVGTQGGYHCQQTCDEAYKVIAGDTGYLLTTPIG